ncbi:restriction endonuclease subunit S [Bizionia myxarmorum]|uniref:Type I restriction modification DNA specificity domain-containing protein n=1 Tax=Bizionia myxarmorum TaxID=291186 RepID=A0A5D0R4Q3_9FLAO|nr:restriction endonuclease subunit S [Bizionia myxarmorum]TYB76462.1 hypothetical protein ES674_12850 [Bizionia myxarmorum]
MAEFKNLPFGKVVKDVTRNYTKIPKTDYLKEGIYPIIDQGKDFICGYTNDIQKVTEKDTPVIIFGDHTRVFKFIDFPFAIGADGVKVLEVDSSLANVEFIYEYLRNINLYNAGYSRHFKYLKEIKIPVPDSIDVQKRIATVLKRTNKLISAREESIILADEFLKHTFLTMFGEPFNNVKEWSLKPISDFGQIVTGNTPSRGNKSFYSSKHIEWIKTDNIKSNELYITPAQEFLSNQGMDSGRAVNQGALLVTCIAGSEKSIGRAALTDRKVCFNQQINAIQPNSDVEPLYLYWLFKISRNYILGFASKGMKKMLSKGEFKKIPLPKPTIEAQLSFSRIAIQGEKLKSKYNESLLELNELYKSLSHKAFNGDLTIIEKIYLEGTIKVQPKISATVEVIEQKQEITTIPEPVKKKEEVTASITHIPFLKTEEDLLSHISRNCSGSHFNFEEIKEAVKGLDWKYDFEELKNLVFSLVRKKQLKQVFADASYKSGFSKSDAAFNEITDLSEQIYFKRIL